MFLRKKSPLFTDVYDEVVRKACSTLDIPYDRCKLLAIQVWQRLTVLVFDVFYDDYDVLEAHKVVDLPVILVDYGKRLSYVRLASPEFREEVNNHVANQHNFNGWTGKPPYIEDQTSSVPPTYCYPRHCYPRNAPFG